MFRILKTLGLSLVALLATTAVAASAASAAEFHSESAPAIYEGSQVVTNEFKFESGIVKCTKVTFSGTQSNKTSSTATLHPSYANCKAGVPVTVTTGGCDYQLHVGSGTTTDVVCSGGSKITMTAIGIECTWTLGGQTGLAGVTLSNTGAGTTRGITAGLNMKTIEYTETGAGCAAAGSHTNGTYAGTVAISGYVDTAGTKGAQQGIWVE